MQERTHSVVCHPLAHLCSRLTGGVRLGRTEVDILSEVLLIAVLAAMLLAPIFLLRWMSGWAGLEQLYGRNDATPSFSRGSFRRVRSRIGWVSVGLCVELYDEGLWMHMRFPAKLITTPVLLPWSAIHLTALRSILLARRVELRVDGFSKVIRFVGDPSGALLQRSQRRGRIEEPNDAPQATREDGRD
jgi:hypothetical protein